MKSVAAGNGTAACGPKIITAIPAAVQAVKSRIRHAAEACGRDPDSVRLLAVSKTFPASYLRAAHGSGQMAFGESYVQEALDKIGGLADLPLEWHFIGPIQSNKTAAVAAHFHWVHSLDRDKVAQRLAAARPAGLPPLNVCIQVNVSAEASKSGVAPEQALALARAVLSLPRLKLRGLMTIPRPSLDPVEQRAQFRVLRKLRDSLETRGIVLDTLSMGMSDDLESAIAEGATLVRVGSAIFGSRT